MQTLAPPQRLANTLVVPGIPEPLSLRLPPDIAALRKAALDFHTTIGTNMPPIPELTLSDAAAWAEHREDEDWLVWRARMVAARLRSMPLEFQQGERIVGRPRFRHPAAGELPALEAARHALTTMPPFPGGDAGHLHPDYDKLLRVGIGGIRKEIAGWQARTQDETEKQPFYAACGIALDGLAAYIDRVATACESRAAAEAGAASMDMSAVLPAFRNECSPRLGNHGAASTTSWLELADMCRHIASEPPRTFREAIQLLFLTLVGLWYGESHGLTSPGRLDRTLRPFYAADLAAGRITPQEALELICTLYIQCNRIMSTGLGLAVMVGGRDGRGRDGRGRDVTNDLTYLCIAARIITGLGYPTVGLSWHRDTPPELMDFAVAMLGHGRGDPAFFNEELIVEGLADHGVPLGDAVNYMNSTCVEIKPVGTSNIWVTQPYFNLPLGLLKVMDEVRRGEQPETTTFEDLEARVRGKLEAKIAAAAADLDRIWQERETRGCFPLASCLTDDCLSRGLDFDRGGARYNWVENSMVGLANLADSLVVVRHLVYETRELTLAQFADILATDFAGQEPLRQRILNRLPKYGNDDDEPDQVATRWAEWLMEISEAQSVGPHRYVPGFFCWIMHERMGSETGATPDGRRAGWPMADGAGAAQGRERHGPTASVLSTTRWSHRKALGGLVHNAKFSANLLQSDADRDALRRLIETYLQRGGFEMQVNVVSRDTLLAAREHPEQYRDLLVRVAGYSDYFVKLTPAMQEEVIARTEHEL